MAKLLSDPKFAVRGRLVAVDNSDLIGPMFTLRIPPKTSDIQRPGSYIDFLLLDTHRKTLQKRIHVDDELEVIGVVLEVEVRPGIRDRVGFDLDLRGSGDGEADEQREGDEPC